MRNIHWHDHWLSPHNWKLSDGNDACGWTITLLLKLAVLIHRACASANANQPNTRAIRRRESSMKPEKSESVGIHG
jgi:hypothetical protein